MNDHDTPARVVIIGGGFGGLFAARALRNDSFSVTLIDRTAQHVFQPLLYQCATGILSEGQITAPLRRVLRKHRTLDCITAEAIGVDVAGQRVICRLPLGGRIDVPYDRLIVGAGVQQSYFGHDEFAQLAPGMKTIADALTIRRRVFGAFEMAETATDPAERSHWLTFALVGAGPTGVELAGQIRELATKTLRAEYRHIEPEDARVLLFDGGSAPLAVFGDRLSSKAAESLRSLGVELHMGSIVTSVDGQRHGCPRPRRQRDALRRGHGAVDRGRRGPADSRGAGRGNRRRAGPGRPDRRAGRPHHRRPPGDLGRSAT